MRLSSKIFINVFLLPSSTKSIKRIAHSRCVLSLVLLNTGTWTWCIRNVYCIQIYYLWPSLRLIYASGSVAAWQTMRKCFIFFGNKFRECGKEKLKRTHLTKSQMVFINHFIKWFRRSPGCIKLLWPNCACKKVNEAWALLNSKLIFASNTKCFHGIVVSSPNSRPHHRSSLVSMSQRSHSNWADWQLAGKANAIIKFNFDVINLVIFLPLFAVRAPWAWRTMLIKSRAVVVKSQTPQSISRSEPKIQKSSKSPFSFSLVHLQRNCRNDSLTKVFKSREDKQFTDWDASSMRA